MKFTAGLDIGNGYVKAKTADIENMKAIGIDLPSAALRLTHSDDLKVENKADVEATIDDIFNKMEASFSSSLVRDNSRYWFGKRAINSGRILTEFDVESHRSKALQDLSGLLVLACIAGSVLKEYYRVNKALPKETLKITVNNALALPITEFKEHREAYAAKFKNGNHIVSIHNFNEIVNVEIKFTDVQVLAEGAAAQYAISKSPKLIEAMLKDLIKRNPNFNTSITANDVAGAQTVVGIDIGEGTVNFPVFVNGQFNPDVSDSINIGYGSVLTNALKRLQDAGYTYTSRKALADFLQTTPTAITQKRYNIAASIVEQESVAFVEELIKGLSRVLAKVGTLTEVIYVYGGGAGGIKEELYPRLLSLEDDFKCDAPVLYLDSSYSRFLNREGLFQISCMVAKVDPNAMSVI